MADPTSTGTDPAAIFTYVGYAIGAVIAAVVARLGWNSGKKALEKPEEMVEIRSAIVDTHAMDRLTAAVEGHTYVLTESKVQSKELGVKIDRASETFETIAEEIRNLGREIREHAREISKHS